MTGGGTFVLLFGLGVVVASVLIFGPRRASKGRVAADMREQRARRAERRARAGARAHLRMEPFQIGTVATDGAVTEGWRQARWGEVAEWALSQSERPGVVRAWVRRSSVVAGTVETWTWEGGLQVSRTVEPRAAEKGGG